MGLSDLLKGYSNKTDTVVAIAVLLQPCVLNVVTILLQQVCMQESLGQPCNKSDIPVQCDTSCEQVVTILLITWDKCSAPTQTS